MDLDGGGYTLDMQAKRVVDNMINYKGSHPCPMCGLIMNPTEALYSKGFCADCYSQHRARRLKNRMV